MTTVGEERRPRGSYPPGILYVSPLSDRDPSILASDGTTRGTVMPFLTLHGTTRGTVRSGYRDRRYHHRDRVLDFLPPHTLFGRELVRQVGGDVAVVDGQPILACMANLAVECATFFHDDEPMRL
jgi:hypothetical protein